MLKTILCACCGAELTKPAFINGLPYGYSCAKLQGAKVSKPKDTCYMFDIVCGRRFGVELTEQERNEKHFSHVDWVIEFNGKKYQVGNPVGKVGNQLILRVDSFITGKTFRIVHNTIGKNEKLFTAVKGN